MKKTNSTAILYLTTACIWALLWGPSARAQQNTQTAAQGEVPGLEEIVVTARKRDEALLDVPVIETAIPRAQLERQQTISVADLPSLVPGLQLGQSELAGGTKVSIRGVGVSTADPGGDQSVTLNLDGLSIANGLAFSSGLFDLQQIEVLKGPQALFFGKSSTAGVIVLRTADPTDKLEVIGRESYEFESVTPREELIASGPVTDTLKLRLASMYSTSEGYFNNEAVAVPGTGAVTPTDSRAPHSTDYILRGTALWDPSSQFSARLKVNYVYDRAILAEATQLENCPEGPNFAPAGVPFIGGDDCKLDGNLRVVWMNPADFPGILNNGVPFLRTTQTYGSLELNYRPLEKLTLTSVTSDYLLQSTSLANGTESTAAGPALAAENIFNQWQLTEEMRLSSDFAMPLNFMVGGLYQDGYIAVTAPIPGNSVYRLPPLLSYGTNTMGIRALSTFGQLRWKLLPHLELAAGLRWTDEARDQDPINLITGVPVPIAVPVPRIDFSNVSPEATLTYKPTDDLMLYAAYKQAYKSGGFTIATLPTPVNPNNSFKDEEALGGEVGLKSRLFDRQLELNVSGYYYHYLDLQVGVNQPAAQSNGEIVALTENAGSARSFGIDVGGVYRPEAISGLNFNGELNWNDARYTRLNNVPCWGGQTIALGCNELFSAGFYTAQNLDGTPMIRAPDWQFNVGFGYEFALWRDLRMTVSNNNAFSSKFVRALAIDRPNNDNYQTSYIKSDVSLSLFPSNGRWEVAVIGKDVNGKITAGNCASSNLANGVIFGGEITGGTTSGPAGVAQNICYPDPGPQIWLRLTVKPFASRN